MASKKNMKSEVEMDVSTSTENGSVQETVVTENVASIAETEVLKELVTETPAEETKSEEVEESKTKKKSSKKTKVEEKVEVSETEKVNDEINENADEAEEEVDVIDDKTAQVAEETKIVDTEVKKPNEKFFGFDKKEARRFFVDKERFLGVIFYKRLLIGISNENIDKLDSIADFAAIVYNNVESLIKSLRFDDVEYMNFSIDEYKARTSAYDIGIMSIDVPFTDKTPLFINKIRKLVNTMFPQCYIRSSSNCRTTIDTTKTSDVSLLKGFVSFSSYMIKKGTTLKVNSRSAAYVSSILGIDEKSLSDMNRYILSSTKLSAVDTDGIIHKQKDGSQVVDKYMDYYQTVKNKLCGMIFEVTNVKDDKFEVYRTQYYVRVRTKKVFDAVIPYGVKIVADKMEPIWVSDLNDIFTWKDPENKAGFLGNDDIVGTEPNIINLNDDLSQIQSNILDDIESVDCAE